MCTTCGCGLPDADHRRRHAHTGALVEVRESLLADNDRAAAHNRAHFDAHGVLAVNLMSSPGAGKTSLLEHTARALGSRLRMAALVGDLATELDAARLRAAGLQAIQITTGQACHLDAALVHEALHALDLDALDVLFIENVGNLVCPASFDLGQHANVVLLSVTEGDDKPAKYPVMFRAADLVLLSKHDLLPHFPEFDSARVAAALERLARPVEVLPVSARSGDGTRAWQAWLEGRRRARAA